MTPSKGARIVRGAFLAFALFMSLAAAGTVFAETQPIGATLSIPIPTVTFSKIKVTGEEGDQYINIPWMAEYISGVYRYAVGVATMVAAVMMMIGGFQYLTAGGDATRVSKGKEKITNAIIGLFLSLGAYLALYTVNPDLVALSALNIRSVKRVPFVGLPDDFPEEETAATVPGVAGALPMTSRRVEGFANSITFNTTAMPDLEAAGAALLAATGEESWGPGRIQGGGFRSITDQARFFENRCIAGILPSDVKLEGRTRCTVPTCNPYESNAFTTDPAGHTGRWLQPGSPTDVTNCPHTSGRAVDISCNTSTSLIGSFHVPCHKQLEEAMKAQGFCRLRTEPWHFEKPKLSGNCDENWTIGQFTENGVSHSYDSCDGWYSSYNTGVTSDSARCCPHPWEGGRCRR